MDSFGSNFCWCIGQSLYIGESKEYINIIVRYLADLYVQLDGGDNFIWQTGKPILYNHHTDWRMYAIYLWINWQKNISTLLTSYFGWQRTKLSVLTVSHKGRWRHSLLTSTEMWGLNNSLVGGVERVGMEGGLRNSITIKSISLRSLGKYPITRLQTRWSE